MQNRNDPILDFTIFCLENYKQSHRYPGAKAAEIFRNLDVFRYLKINYLVLHSLGDKALVQDLDTYIATRQEKG
jgi:hypothetical protein